MIETTFTILLGGTLHPTDRLKRAVMHSRAIAADGGMRHAAPLGLTPELWVGDFDSSGDVAVDAFPDIERMPYPAQKNLTDGEIAIEQARARGATRLVLAGALGGERSDHALMHLLLSVALAGEGLDVHLSSGTEEAWPLLPGRVLTLDLPKGSLFSILGFSALKGLSILGARYPLKDFSLAFGSSRTISNVAEGPVTLSLDSGDAVVLARPYDMTGA
ncbi:thiamine diphosphokinase [Allorhizobium terrae]|uniref:Thiamine diphosphokinase n=1 Tax=Allorhizobium terrae TaxID=1848972 RepID=A0A4S3ZWP0_9HYPH|nr:thiamine diphosphokinase [Allorhizobium terrae]THF50209.1 thiamine diphosphokinase [Allorhizobium terrae]